MIDNSIFVDSDSYHPKSNIEKMSNKIPLTDKDRLPWLLRIRSDIDNLFKNQKLALNNVNKNETHQTIATTTTSNINSSVDWNRNDKGRTLIIACSALKVIYRDLLRGIIDSFDDDLNSNSNSNSNNRKNNNNINSKENLNENLWFIMLDAKKNEISRRILSRNSSNHFMPQALLDSQFNTLEFPDINKEKDAIIYRFTSDNVQFNGKQIVERLVAKGLVGLRRSKTRSTNTIVCSLL